MSLASRLRSDVVTVQALSRMLPRAHDLLPLVRSSASTLLRDRARSQPDRPAILWEDRRFTYAALEARTNQWARFLRSRGVGPGTVVALMMDNRPDYAAVLIAVNRLGGICACLNTHAKGRALQHALSAARGEHVVVGSEHAAAIDAIRQDLPASIPIFVHGDQDRPAAGTVNADVDQAAPDPLPGVDRTRTGDTMTYLYTSGTTGLPKAATVTNRRFLAASHAFARVLEELTPEDVIYSALPLYHGTAQWAGLGAALASGAALALRRRFSASAFWHDVNAFGATRILYVGELCRYLLNSPAAPGERTHRVRIACGNGLRRDVWAPFQERFRIPWIREFYGATEGTAPLMNLENRVGMVGRLAIGQALVEYDPDTGAALRDGSGRCRKVEEPGRTGLLIGRLSPLLRFDGYTDERATRSKVLTDVFRKGDSYFDTGDLMTLHEDGWLSFTDRVGDTFRWKGENVSTTEVAEVLNLAPGVLDSIVYGVAVHGAEGRAGMAALSVSPEFDLDALARHVLERLPSYQRPYFLRLSAGLETTSTFKHTKVSYRNEGYDPARVRDPLYFLDGDTYVRIDTALFERLSTGALAPR